MLVWVLLLGVVGIGVGVAVVVDGGCWWCCFCLGRWRAKCDPRSRRANCSYGVLVVVIVIWDVSVDCFSCLCCCSCPIGDEQVPVERRSKSRGGFEAAIPLAGVLASSLPAFLRR